MTKTKIYKAIENLYETEVKLSENYSKQISIMDSNFDKYLNENGKPSLAFAEASVQFRQLLNESRNKQLKILTFLLEQNN